MAAATSTEVATMKSEKKHKKEKSSKSEKKRAREEDGVAEDDGGRKHKKSKSIAGDAIAPSDEASASQEVKNEKKSKKKEKKSKHHDDDAAAAEADDAGEAKSEKKKKKKKHRDHAEAEVEANAEPALELHSKEEKKEKRRKKKHAEVTDEVVDDVLEKPKKSKKSKHHTANDEQDQQADVDAMEVDEPTSSKSSKAYQPPDIPASPHFPFFHQTVSLYEPIYPNGWAQPVTSCQYQHLQHLHNKYVPSLRGVLLDYRNVSLGPEPGREGAATDDETPTTVVSEAEYAVGFGWITADVDLFVPSRGAWMEGSVNLQTEGHIGVVCFGKFNASIEARRLPPSWKWVSNESTEARGFEETASVITADDHGVVRQIHSTGFWVDGDGDRVKGKIRFRIRNFDAGTSGETSYLSLEGTMLDKDSEKKLVKEEARIAHMRREKKGGRKIERRRAPDFSMTRFVDDDEEQGEGEQQPAAEAAAVDV